jgi:ketosteroid isomerase-like protein
LRLSDQPTQVRGLGGGGRLRPARHEIRNFRSGSIVLKKKLGKMYSGVSELKLTQTDGPHIQVKGDVAWSMGMVNAEGKLKSGPAISAPTFETDVFEKRDGKWLRVSHIASSAPR